MSNWSNTQKIMKLTIGRIFLNEVSVRSAGEGVKTQYLISDSKHLANANQQVLYNHERLPNSTCHALMLASRQN